MKVIFLDVDGVLTDEISNDDETLKSVASIREEKIEILKQIVDRTDAKIVMHSTWRYYYEYEGETVYSDNYYILIELLQKHNLELYDHAPIIKRTGNIIKELSLEEIQTLKITPEFSRARAINAWLETHPEVESFVIFDDYPFHWDYFGYQENWIKTYYWGNKKEELGILPKHVDQAIDILNNTKVRTR